MLKSIGERVEDLLDDYTGRTVKVKRLQSDYWAVDTIVKVETECGLVAIVWLDGPNAGDIEEGLSWDR